MNHISPKEKLHQHCQALLQNRLLAMQAQISDLSEDAKNDAKGSAGDKHETALAMMHREQEKLSAKLSEILAQQAVLKSINPSQVYTKIKLGSLVHCLGGWFYISVALAKMVLDGEVFYAISPQSPLGQALLGKRMGDDFVLNGKSSPILELF
jgi:transcription elongation GreA/GreB family factor